MFSLPWKTLTNTTKSLSCIFIVQIINYLEQGRLLTAQTVQRRCRCVRGGAERQRPLILRLINSTWRCVCLISHLPPVCSGEQLTEASASPQRAGAQLLTCHLRDSHKRVLLLPSTRGFLRRWICLFP